MAAAYYIAKMGVSVTLYEKREKLGGIVSAVIPDFRIDDSVIAKDAALLEKLGVTIRYNEKAPAVNELRAQYDDVIVAVGAYERSELVLEGKKAYNALEFLEDFNRTEGRWKTANFSAMCWRLLSRMHPEEPV